MAPGWKINIVGHDVKPASWFLANPMNVRIHPKAQTDATRGSLNQIGWIKGVTVNKRTSPLWGPDQGVETLIDGHDRIKLALQEDEETPVPLDFVDLDPNEENLALLVFDAITAMAINDKEKVDALLRETHASDAALAQFLSELVVKDGLYRGNGTPVDDPIAEWQDMPEFVHEDKTAFQTIALHFKDQQAVDEFAKFAGQRITSKTKFLWYPKQEIIRYGVAE